MYEEITTVRDQEEDDYDNDNDVVDIGAEHAFRFTQSINPSRGGMLNAMWCGLAEEYTRKATAPFCGVLSC